MTEAMVPAAGSGRPWLTVVMPTFDGQAWLSGALASVEAQGRALSSVEILAVDDGSTDRTLEILRHYSSRLPLRILPGERTGNWVANTNRALAAARGEWVGFLHQDDTWLPERLSRLRRTCSGREEVVLGLHAVWFLDASGWRLGQWRCPLPGGRVLDGEEVRERLLVQNFIALPAPIVRLRAALDVGGLDESLWYAADWDFWLKLCSLGKIFYDAEPLAGFRVHGFSQTATGRPDEIRRQLETVLARHLPDEEGHSWGSVRRAARLSVEANAVLAARGRGSGALLRAAAALSPSDWRRFLRDSRLTERLVSRLVGLLGSTRGPALDQGGRLSERLQSVDAPAAGLEPSRELQEPTDYAGSPPQVSVVLPCRNEQTTVGAAVDEALRGLERAGMTGEVIVVDNGSADRSAEEAQRHGARVVHERTPGYGSAVQTGIEAARGEWILTGDADQSDDLSDPGRFFEKLQAGADLVVGCRLPGGGGRIEPAALSWSARWILAPLVSVLGRVLAGSSVHDLEGGARAFRRDAILSLKLRTTGAEYATEMVLKATRSALEVTEVPVALRRTRRPGARRRGTRSEWRHLRFLLLYSPHGLFLAPGLSLVLVGLILGGRLLSGPLRVGGVTLDTNSLLICSMSLVVGLQLCLFAVFAEVFAVTEGLLPPAPGYPVLFRIFTLERGILAGATLVFVGLALMVRTVFLWKSAGFGGMSYAESLRLIIPAVTCVTVGVQAAFSSFFLSLLGLHRR